MAGFCLRLPIFVLPISMRVHLGLDTGMYLCDMIYILSGLEEKMVYNSVHEI